MKQKTDLTLRLGIVAIILLLGVIAFRPVIEPRLKVLADGAKFDHITIASTVFLYKGKTGLLLLDRRNGNVWFVAMSNDESKPKPFEEPLFLVKAPFEKLDHPPDDGVNLAPSGQ